MEKIRIDYLNFHPEYKVCQHEDMYHFNSDTCLLGEFLKVNENEQALDVGTNNGALLVYIIKKGGIATGIEINKKALEVCKMTLSINNLNATLINEDFKAWDNSKKFDVIVCNPPYFDTKEDAKKSINEHIRIARHEDKLTLKQLCETLPKHLSSNGRIYLVYRPNRFSELNKYLNLNNLYINEYQDVYDKSTNKHRSVLVFASFNNIKMKKLEDLYI